VLKLQRPPPDGMLRILARGVKECCDIRFIVRPTNDVSQSDATENGGNDRNPNRTETPQAAPVARDLERDRAKRGTAT